MPKKSRVERFLEPKPKAQKFSGRAPSDVLAELARIKKELKLKSRNKLMVAAFRMLIASHRKGSK